MANYGQAPQLGVSYFNNFCPDYEKLKQDIRNLKLYQEHMHALNK